MTRLIDALPEPKVVREKKLIVLSRSSVGTFSLYQALKMLGYKPYHMYETITSGPSQMRIFEEALRCKYMDGGKPYGKAELDKWLADFDSVVEIPQFFIEEFIQCYPDAKFILTERSNESWMKSMKSTAGPMFKACRSFPLNAVRLVDSFVDSFCDLHFALEYATFHGKDSDTGADYAINNYVNGNEKAKAMLPRDKLTVCRLEDGFGWEEICPFLGLDIPSERYPKGNAPAEFEKLGRQILAPPIRKASAMAFGVVVIPAVAAGIWFYRRA